MSVLRTSYLNLRNFVGSFIANVIRKVKAEVTLPAIFLIHGRERRTAPEMPKARELYSKEITGEVVKQRVLI